MHNNAKQVKLFLQSPEATASAFVALGWDVSRHIHGSTYWCEVTYGLLEELEIEIDLDRDNWAVWMYLPPVRPFLASAADRICRELQQNHPPLVATMDEDNSILLGRVGKDEILPYLQQLWAVFAQEDVYLSVLDICGMTDGSAGYEMGMGNDVDNPFDDEE